MTTQGTKTGTEGAVEPEKIVEPTQPKEEPTGYKTKEEYNKALQTGVSKGLESIQRQLDLRRAETDAAKAETAREKAEREGVSAELKDITEELETITKAIEDSDIKSGVLSKRVLGEDRRKVLKLKAEAEQKLYDVEVKVWRTNMDARAKELVKETGIDINEFIGCNTEADMEVKALRYSLANPKPNKEPEEEPGKTPTFAGAGGEGGGDRVYTKETLKNMSVDEYREHQKEIDEAYLQGRIK